MGESKTVIGECALCKKRSELQLSHIIPKFVIRYLKKTSVGNIRSTEDPNKIVQDGEKLYLLCKECEKRFNVAETKFAKFIFYPYIKNDCRSFNYDKWLHYFMISLAWRNLYLDIVNFVREHDVELNDLQVLIDSEKITRDYLMGRRHDVDEIETHLFFFDDILSASKEIAKLNPHTFFRRGEGGYTFYSSLNETYVTISNLMGIVVIVIYKKGIDEKWVNTRIINGAETILAKNQMITSIVSNEFIEWMKIIKSKEQELNKEQVEKIKKNIADNKESILNSEVYRNLRKDYSLNGDKPHN